MAVAARAVPARAGRYATGGSASPPVARPGPSAPMATACAPIPPATSAVARRAMSSAKAPGVARPRTCASRPPNASTGRSAPAQLSPAAPATMSAGRSSPSVGVDLSGRVGASPEPTARPSVPRCPPAISARPPRVTASALRMPNVATMRSAPTSAAAIRACCRSPGGASRRVHRASPDRWSVVEPLRSTAP
jgi:hypothetical protein